MVVTAAVDSTPCVSHRGVEHADGDGGRHRVRLHRRGRVRDTDGDRGSHQRCREYAHGVGGRKRDRWQDRTSGRTVSP